VIDALIMDGSVTLIAIGVIGCELVLLFALTRFRPSAPMVALVSNALSGMFLILALRAALLGSGATLIGVWLGLGFVAHVGDILFRLRS
jgi:hypothetical protein